MALLVAFVQKEMRKDSVLSLVLRAWEILYYLHEISGRLPREHVYNFLLFIL